MSLDSAESLRLVFKRVFVEYYLELQSPAIADPTEVFAGCRSYLGALQRQLGQVEFMRRLDDEATNLVAQIEQDLRYRLRGRFDRLKCDDLEDRLRECFEHAMGRLADASQGIRVE